jgi:hypothetical protein
MMDTLLRNLLDAIWIQLESKQKGDAMLSAWQADLKPPLGWHQVASLMIV